jgi:phosphotransferase system  glucose/maltose/N-acetylglucosamine-specific IIC component
MPISLNFSEILTTGVQGLFYLLLCAFALHAVFLAYHWFAFGSSKQVSMIALAIYLSGGAILFMTLSVSLNLL